MKRCSECDAEMDAYESVCPQCGHGLAQVAERKRQDEAAKPKRTPTIDLADLAGKWEGMSPPARRAAMRARMLGTDRGLIARLAKLLGMTSRPKPPVARRVAARMLVLAGIVGRGSRSNGGKRVSTRRSPGSNPWASPVNWSLLSEHSSDNPSAGRTRQSRTTRGLAHRNPGRARMGVEPIRASGVRCRGLDRISPGERRHQQPGSRSTNAQLRRTETARDDRSICRPGHGGDLEASAVSSVSRALGFRWPPARSRIVQGGVARGDPHSGWRPGGRHSSDCERPAGRRRPLREDRP